MLCRKGNINRSEVGIIQIFDNETKIEISKKVAADFIKNMKRPGGDNITVQQIDFNKIEVENCPKNAAGKNKKQNKKSPTKDNSKSNHDK